MQPVSLRGRYLDGAGIEHECTVRGSSPEALEIVSGRLPAPGERIVCHVPGLGLLTARATGSTDASRRLAVLAGPAQRHRLAARLRWHQAHRGGALERRDATRVAPIQTDIMVAWEAKQVTGYLTDVSARGAAVNLDPRPPIGSPVVLGRRRAHVVRHTEKGVGVRFVLPLSPENVTEDVIL